MTLISIKKTAVVEPAPTGTVSLYVDSADSHLKQVDEAGAIIDLTDGSATSSPNMAQLINITLETLVVDVVNEGLINPKACYRITDSTQGIIRVWGKSATELTATAMLEGSDDGSTVTNGQWGNYDLDADVFTGSDSGTWTPTISAETGALSNVIISVAQYSKNGKLVTCTIRGTADVDFSANDTGSFSITFPIATAASNATGVASTEQPNQCNGSIRNNAIAYASLDTSFIAPIELYAIFQYEVN